MDLHGVNFYIKYMRVLMHVYTVAYNSYSDSA